MIIESHKPNPFRTLRLPTNATYEEIVSRVQELYDATDDEDQKLLYLWAKEQLRITTTPRNRWLHELFEIPSTHYEEPEWQDYLDRYRKNPVRPDDLTQSISPPSQDDINIATLIQLLKAALLIVPEADLLQVIAHVPFLPSDKISLEVRDVLFG